MHFSLPSSLRHCWLGIKKSIRSVKMSDEVLAWLSVWNEVQMTCIWSSWCHCHPIISRFLKIQNSFAFPMPAYQVVLEKGPLNVCLMTHFSLLSLESYTESGVHGIRRWWIKTEYSPLSDFPWLGQFFDFLLVLRHGWITGMASNVYKSYSSSSQKLCLKGPGLVQPWSNLWKEDQFSKNWN